MINLRQIFKQISVLTLLLSTIITANNISNIQFNPSSHSLVEFNQQIFITFNYSTDETEGVYILMKPLTDGDFTPNFQASGSPLYAQGSGNGQNNFTITSGAVTVDELQIKVYKSDMSEVLHEFYIPVEFIFSNLSVTNVQFNPLSPAIMPHNEQIIISFDYFTEETDGIYIFYKPLTEGDFTPNSLTSGSPLYAGGEGSGISNFTVTEGEVVIDELQLQVYNSTMTDLLAEIFIPVEFTYSSLSISNVRFENTTPSMLFNEKVFFTFDYVSEEGDGVFIFMKPFTDGDFTPNSINSGSPHYTQMRGTGTGNFSVTEGEVKVDQLQVQMYTSDMSTVLIEFFIPVDYIFSNNSIYNMEFNPPCPAFMPFNQHAKISFDFMNDTGGNVYIIAKPYTEGVLTPNQIFGGSPPYSAGEGSGFCNFTISADEVIVDQILVEMYENDPTEPILEFFIPVKYSYGTVTDISDQSALVPEVYILNQNYPNPFNPSTIISYSLPENTFVSLKVYDILGSEIGTLVNKYQSAGKYQINFNTDEFEKNLSSGVYLYRIQTANFTKAKKMILVR